MRGLANKGRNTELIRYRNEKLAARFYYYSYLLGLKFSRCLEHLTPEFDLSESRICDLISEHTEYINRLEMQKTTITELKQVYPFMVWQLPASNRRNNAKQLSLDLFSNFAP
ncbi:hypothetical protein [Riemerella anatipestifer]|uniref:Uncharacterized protein n=1 Tax=Riemerella anatipestifer TaxID=34085 RepID=A0AAP3ALQ4_RIEAN|nr:hypothetical protein [Riemerella anatipestifer]MBT0573843.1 hypothetical protein [Riemerella anatipestifer]MCO7331403.1 hypothetical protein [Riemerella anatipestifer]MCO7350126.1 hypothetical protein [Riemerella anatipestifer]MCT6765651.1 hypothetical protein [Riemerella anatipestifer]MCT6769830.1 hypothetical protein [Riemerella anatipestifer]